LKFKSHVAIYPVCWAHKAIIQRTAPKAAVSGFPVDLEDRWTGKPLRIFAGPADDYEGRDSTVCRAFIDLLPPSQKAVTSLSLFRGATHSWDQPSHSTSSPLACQGKGCEVHTVYNPEVTQTAKTELLKFLLQ